MMNRPARTGIGNSRQQECAACGIRLNERANINIALCDHAVVRRYHTLVGLLLVQHAQLRDLRIDIGLRDGDRSSPCLQGLGGRCRPVAR